MNCITETKRNGFQRPGTGGTFEELDLDGGVHLTIKKISDNSVILTYSTFAQHFQHVLTIHKLGGAFHLGVKIKKNTKIICKITFNLRFIGNSAGYDINPLNLCESRKYGTILIFPKSCVAKMNLN